MLNKDVAKMYMGLRELTSLSVPARVAFAMNRNLKAMESIFEDFENARMSIGQKYGELKDIDGRQSYIIPGEKLDAAKEEMIALELIDNPDLYLHKIKLSDLDGTNLTMDQIDALYPMISEED